MPDTEPIEIHSPQVGMYRMGEFLNLGFDVEQAGSLANSKVDLTEVRNAIRNGCAVQMAWEIWRG
jgi:hypothetical protein